MPTIDLPSGTIDYLDEGEGPVVLMVHGFLVDAGLWRPVADLLRAGHRCVMPQMPFGSHRRAMGAGADMTPAGLARLVGELAEALDLAEVTLVGNDTGGLVCQLVALDHGERVARLVLTNCDAFETFPPKAFLPLVVVGRRPLGLRVLGWALLRSRALRNSPAAYGLLANGLSDEETRGWVTPVAQDGGVRADTARLMQSVSTRISRDAAARLGGLRIPVVVAWGQADPFFGRALGRRLAAAIPGARLEEIAGSRAFVGRDAPDRLAAVVQALAAATSDRQTAG